jgi:hypothetical protein
MDAGYLWKSQNDQDIGSWIILRWILERDRMGWDDVE